MKLKKRRTREIKVGFFIILALTVIVCAVFFIGGQSTLFGKKVKYKILFNSTGGLYEGDPVLLTGVEVGNVTRLGFPEDIHQKKIVVEISVLKDVSSRIRMDTRARIGSASIVYGKIVELSMGSLKEPVIPEGGTIEAEEGTNYSAIVDTTNLIVGDIRRMLTRIDKGEGMLGMLLNEPLEMRQTLHNLSVTSNSLSRLMERVERGEGSLGILLSDSVDVRQALKDMNQAVSDLGEVVKNLKGSQSIAGKLINDEEYGRSLSEDLRSAVHSIASITAKIDSGEGTLGSLINDKELYFGLQDVVLGVKSSSVAKWLIQNRRKAGEKERMKKIGEGTENGN